MHCMWVCLGNKVCDDACYVRIVNLVIHSRVLAAVALVLVLVFDVVTVAAADHRQLLVCQHGFAGKHLPDGTVTITHVVDKPGGSMTHFMNQGVSQTVCKQQLKTTLHSKAVNTRELKTESTSSKT